ncbi:hypothetical protein niasHT_023538 [Heterodera trifolii]|uniref:Uncharacterized protein n=1 Tax=Heterodera trifolii TaxID=157864 RepID=A0ABD2JEM2_9BILA
MASQISKILPTLLFIAAAFLLNFGCCQQNESQTPGTLRARNASSSTQFPLNTTTITTKKETTVATPSTATTADDKNDDQSLLFWILIGVIAAIVLFLVLLVCIVCCMRRGSQEDARETVNGESGGAVTNLTMNGDNADSSMASQSTSRMTSTNCCSQSVGSSMMVWPQPVAKLQLASFRGENEVPLDDDMSTTTSTAVESGIVTTFKDSTMDGHNADTSSASQSASKPDEGWFVPDSLHSVTMTDLAKVNARLAQGKKQQEAPKQ